MHREVVVRRGWIDEDRFQRALAFCMALPGPEAQQLAMYLGWHLHGYSGGTFAGAAFIVPSIAVMLALSWLAVAGDGLPAVAGTLLGLQASVLGLVVDAIARLGRRLTGDPWRIGVAVVTYAVLASGLASFPLAIAVAGSVGVAQGWRLRRVTGATRVNAVERLPAPSGEAPPRLLAEVRRGARVFAVTFVAWAVPMAVVAAWRGTGDLLVQIGMFFTRASFATFGGAYAVLAYVADEAVTRLGWLDATRMAQGLGLAESTPGPLIMVTHFVGFVAAWNDPGDLPRLQAAVIGGLLATWGTFLPGFFLVLAGAPLVERIATNRVVSDALSGISGAVVGTIASLATFIATEVIGNAPAGDAAFAVATGAATFVAVRFAHVPPYAVVPIGAVVGIAWTLARA